MTVAEIRGWCDLAVTEFSKSINAIYAGWRESEYSPTNLAASSKAMEEAQGMPMSQALVSYQVEGTRTATELDIASRVLPAILEGMTCLEKGYSAMLGAGMDGTQELLEAGVSISRANEYYQNASGAQVLVITHLESVPNLPHGVVPETISYAAQNANTVLADVVAGMSATRGAIEMIQAYAARL